MLATLAGGSLALATDFARQALSALVECSFRGSAFPTFPDGPGGQGQKCIPDVYVCLKMLDVVLQQALQPLMQAFKPDITLLGKNKLHHLV